MTKFKRWLYLKFLPDWCRHDLMETNKQLVNTISKQKVEIDRLNAYIDGIETGMRTQRRISITQNSATESPLSIIRRAVREELQNNEVKP